VRVLVTGHDGYIGTVLVPMLSAAGHDVVGLDSGLFRDCTFGPPPAPVPGLLLDVRDVEPRHLQRVDAIVHLAAVSNDPLGDLAPVSTLEINHRATVRLAEVAKDAGVRRFLFSSSCSLYGAHGDDPIDESAAFHPVTPYGESKVLSERELRALADDGFSPTYLRNATAFGVSPRLRGDLVVNNLTGYAHATGVVLMKSDGTPWRPLVHVEDIARVFVAVLDAPLDVVHDEAFNVGATDQNFRVRDVAAMVEEVVRGSTVTFAENAGPDARNYRVNCDKLARLLPSATPRRTVRQGIEELADAYQRLGLTLEDLTGRYLRVARVRARIEAGELDESLRWTPSESTPLTLAGG
jgi:nucleoside-diphosphate-sugar epimerase